PIPSYFVSRPELSNPIRQRLLTRSNAAGVRRILAIRGLGGSGKSTIAAALAWDAEVRERFRDGVLWVILSQQPETL
ncbi:MAG TPA: NB-ARC domain-containing protein, partial [Bryobacteraceae bacterium]|nr:NB-ARC domain-containing protein [Bryobacteraceae bacterium]